MAMLLIENGADLNARDIGGRSPLYFSASNNNDYLVKVYI